MEFHKKLYMKNKNEFVANKRITSKARPFPSHSRTNVSSMQKYQYTNQTLTENNMANNILYALPDENIPAFNEGKRNVSEKINTSGHVQNVQPSSLVINLCPKNKKKMPTKKYYRQIRNANPSKQQEYQSQFQSLTSSQKSFPNSLYVNAYTTPNNNSKEKNSNSSIGKYNLNLRRSLKHVRNVRNINNRNMNNNELEIEINNDEEDDQSPSPKIRYHRPRKYSPLYPYENEEIIYNVPYNEEDSNEKINTNYQNQYFDAYEVNEDGDPPKFRVINNNNPLYGNPFIYSSDDGQENSVKFEEERKNVNMQKRLVRKFTDIYDPRKNKKGILLQNNKLTVSLGEAPIFNEERIRYFSRNSKLSDIIMTKKQYSPDPFSMGYDDFYSGSEDKTTCQNERNIKTFNRKSFEKFHEKRKSIKISKSPEEKFKNFSLAMISSKGLNTENRPILRKMRFEKGGVVDLAQDDSKKNRFKYSIKKIKRSPGKQLFHNNPKYREQAAEVIQDWWYAIKEYKKKKIQSAILIQSIFRGRFVRKYLYDVIYMNYLYFGFCKKIEKLIRKKFGPYFFDCLFSKFF